MYMYNTCIYINNSNGTRYGRMDGWMDGWMDEWMDR